MKTCSCCNKEFPLEEFAFKNKKLNKMVAMCNGCRKERQKQSYYKHHQTNLTRVKNYKRQNKDWFFEMKDNLSCCVCKESDSSCLDFHHIDEEDKDFNISNYSEASKNKLIGEINKCACLCANCHRKYHAGKLFAPLVKLNIT